MELPNEDMEGVRSEKCDTPHLAGVCICLLFCKLVNYLIRLVLLAGQCVICFHIVDTTLVRPTIVANTRHILMVQS